MRPAAPAFALALLVAACVPGSGARAPSGPASAARGLMPDAEGLQPAGTTLRIDFGRAQDGVIAAVSRLLGEEPARVTRTPGCRAADTEIAWPSGLVLAFRAGSFVGWRASSGASPSVVPA